MALHSIMIVDDNEDMLTIYTRVLIKEGFEVFTATTGAGCLAQITSIRPEIFLLDVILPDWNGIDLVQEIKSRTEFANSMFVLLSGLMTDSASKIKGLDAGAVDYLARPIPNKELVAKVKSLVKVMDFQESLVVLSKELDQRVSERTHELETSIKDLQLEIENRIRLEEQFRQAQKMEIVGTLAGGIAHDFNNFLQIISVSAFMRRGEDVKKGIHSLEIDQIIDAVDQAARLTHGLLAFSRRQALDLQTLKLNDLIQQSVKMGRCLVEESVSICTELCSENLVVTADSGLIQQVLFNLITNARDAMNSGGIITVRTVLETVDASFRPRSLALPGAPTPGNYAVISVSDSAAGIPSDILAYIFDPFFTTKEIGKGTGLGLSMIHGTIMQHQGFIVVDSSSETGTIFSIYLHQLEHTDTIMCCEPSEFPVKVTAGRTILVVEDNDSIRDLMIMALSEIGYEMIAAKNGREAVELFQARHNSVSLIIMDIIMPEMNGQLALDRMREIRADIPCLFMTGYGAEVLERHNVSSLKTIIRKPFKFLDLMNKIHAILEPSSNKVPVG
ncbi:MAG: response regulator [Deltaproteobacteria bacterium]|nr:response regulator [Deltaproteobacteria bacterium]